MIHISVFREKPKTIKQSLKKRGLKTDVVDKVIIADNKWREVLARADKLKHERNVAGVEIAKLKKQGKSTASTIKKMKTVAHKLEKFEAERRKWAEQRDELRMRIPNLLHKSVPLGKDEAANKEVKRFGTMKKPRFELKPHQDIAANLGLADFDSAAEVSGRGFYYLFNGLYLLDLALQRFALDFLQSKGFTLASTPLLLRKKAIGGAINIEDFEDVIYKVEDEDLYLIGTAEHSLVSLAAKKTFPEKYLPLRLASASPCFRKEIGAHGVDTRGVFRVHQFNKVEQVSVTRPEESWEEFEFLQSNAEAIFKKLKIPFRVVEVCTGDIGGTAAKKLDIEAWMPRQARFREVTSCSNCTDYQSNKLRIRVESKDGSRRPAHTINSTGVATSRAIVAILENFQQKNGSVKIPSVLHAYMNGLKELRA